MNDELDADALRPTDKGQPDGQEAGLQAHAEATTAHETDPVVHNPTDTNAAADEAGAKVEADRVPNTPEVMLSVTGKNQQVLNYRVDRTEAERIIEGWHGGVQTVTFAYLGIIDDPAHANVPGHHSAPATKVVVAELPE